jgi:hypothetical protein
VDDERLAESRGPRWTRADDYVAALARRRSARRGREVRRRTQPEAPRFSLSTLPFVALLAALAILAVAIAVAAFPGSQPQPRSAQPAERQQGVAPRGWFQEAQRDFHR